MHLETQRNLALAMEETGLPCAMMLDILGTEVVVTNRCHGCTHDQRPRCVANCLALARSYFVGIAQG